MSADVLPSYSEASSGSNTEGHSHGASDDQKLFVVVSVATATACFVVNAVIAVALIGRRFCSWPCRRRALRTSSENRTHTSDALHLSQAVAGLLASVASIYPIELIAVQEGTSDAAEREASPDLSFFTSRTVCYSLASAPLLASVLAALGTNSLMALEQHLLLPALRSQAGARDAGRSACTFRCGAPVLPAALATLWIITLTVSIMPILGPGSRWLGMCVLPGAWADVFTAVVAAILLLLILLPVYLYAGIFVRHRGATPSIRYADSGSGGEERSGSSEEVPICEPPSAQCSDPDEYPPVLRPAPSFRRAKANFIHFCLLLACYLPVALHLLSRVGTTDASFGPADATVMLERDSKLPWAALLVVVAGLASPLVYLLVDDELPGLTAELARAPICECCWSTKKAVSLKSETAFDQPFGCCEWNEILSLPSNCETT